MLTIVSRPEANTSKINVLAIGAWDSGEFAIALTGLAGNDGWNFVDHCDSALQKIDHGDALPHLIFLASPIPNHFEQHEIDKLRRSAPLAEIVLVAGTWCEGELRTGKPVTGVVRLYWHELAHWWRGRIRNDVLFSSLDGAHSARCLKLQESRVWDDIIGIRTPSYDSFEALAEPLRKRGLTAVWVRAGSQLPERISIAIWDGGQLDAHELPALQHFAIAAKDRGSSLIVLLNFPRKEHERLLRKIGCKALFGKPYVVSDLISSCEAAIESPVLKGGA